MDRSSGQGQIRDNMWNTCPAETYSPGKDNIYVKWFFCTYNPSYRVHELERLNDIRLVVIQL
jgi:hypothetical protein